MRQDSTESILVKMSERLPNKVGRNIALSRRVRIHSWSQSMCFMRDRNQFPSAKMLEREWFCDLRVWVVQYVRRFSLGSTFSTSAMVSYDTRHCVSKLLCRLNRLRRATVDTAAIVTLASGRHANSRTRWRTVAIVTWAQGRNANILVICKA